MAAGGGSFRAGNVCVSSAFLDSVVSRLHEPSPGQCRRLSNDRALGCPRSEFSGGHMPRRASHFFEVRDLFRRSTSAHRNSCFQVVGSIREPARSPVTLLLRRTDASWGW